MIYRSQIITLHTLNLYSDMCQSWGFPDDSDGKESACIIPSFSLFRVLILASWTCWTWENSGKSTVLGVRAHLISQLTLGK